MSWRPIWEDHRPQGDPGLGRSARGDAGDGARHGRQGRAGLLRIDFPGHSGDRFEEIAWDEWFQKFDENELAFLYQERTKDGKESRFFKLVRREGGHTKERGKDKGR